MGDATLSLAAECIAAARDQNVYCATAESLTGGLLAAAFVSVPGASRVFTGSVVAYETALKHSVLGVNAELLRLRGPVDPDVAAQMSHGARQVCGSELSAPRLFGIATTGVAGPDPDQQSGQTAGTVWIAISGCGLPDRVERLSLSGDRQQIREATVQACLELLLSQVETLRRHKILESS